MEGYGLARKEQAPGPFAILIGGKCCVPQMLSCNVGFYGNCSNSGELALKNGFGYVNFSWKYGVCQCLVEGKTIISSYDIGPAFCP